MTVTDVRDFLQVLRQHPEWRAAVRQEVLGDELLSLPDLVRQNSIDIAANSAAIRELREIVEQHSADTRAMVAVQERLLVQTAQLVLDGADMRRDVSGLRADAKGLRADVATLQGDMLEVKFTQNPSRIVPPGRLRRPRSVIAGDLEKLQDGFEAGLLTQDERDAVFLADLLVQGRQGSGATAEDVLLVLELSRTIHSHDIERAAARALVLRKVGYHAVAAVGGNSVDPRDRQLAEEAGVEIYLSAALR